MLECWNVGLLSFVFCPNMSFFAFPVKTDFANKPMSHFARTHYSSIPVFQYSNCERSELSTQSDLIAKIIRPSHEVSRKRETAM